MMELPVNLDVKRIGGHMSRQRYQRGTLEPFVPAAKGKSKRLLPRGTYWARWYRYIKLSDGREKRSPREKIITKELARNYRIGNEYEAPLNQGRRSACSRFADRARCRNLHPARHGFHFGQIAREYLATVEPGWGLHTVRTSKGLIEHALVGGKLGSRPVVAFTEIELQQFLNEHVSSGASRSKLTKLLLYLRNILDHAVMKKVILANPARNPHYRLKAKSRSGVGWNVWIRSRERGCFRHQKVGFGHRRTT
jgi:hypothetical protein